MLDMGFADAVDTIVTACSPERQTLLFSATYPESIKKISARYQYQPQDVTVESLHTEQQIEQHFYELRETDSKTQAVQQLLAEFQPQSAIVFCNTKQQCHDLYLILREQGISALALHGDLEQKDRDRVLVCFANKSCALLIATDVAARGIDIKDLDAVINFELAHDPEVHIHRIGRTARAGASGLALTMVAPKELGRVNRLEDYLAATITLEPLPHSSQTYTYVPEMVTLCIDGGKKDKLRAGDVLGALTKDAGLAGTSVGKITIFNFCTYVAVHRAVAKAALQHLQNGKLKGRKFRARYA